MTVVRFFGELALSVEDCNSMAACCDCGSRICLLSWRKRERPMIENASLSLLEDTCLVV